MPKRRRFSAEEKLRILKEADACTQPGEQGALLRREGLYSSHLTEWRRARERGELDALEPKKRGRKPAAINPLEKKVAELAARAGEGGGAGQARGGVGGAAKKSLGAAGHPASEGGRARDGRHQAARPRVGHRRHVRRPRRGPRDVLPAAPASDARPGAEAGQPEGACRPRRRTRCWTSCTKSASQTWRPPRSTRHCSTRGGTSAASGRCTACWPTSGEIRERRDQLRHPKYAAPELLATAPNQLWSWDISVPQQAA